MIYGLVVWADMWSCWAEYVEDQDFGEKKGQILFSLDPIRIGP